jgi:hypothetical protein
MAPSLIRQANFFKTNKKTSKMGQMKICLFFLASFFATFGAKFCLTCGLFIGIFGGN